MNCLYCGIPLPATSRRDRMYCNNRCHAWASYWRGRNGEPVPPRWQHPALTSVDPVLHVAAIRAQQLGEAHSWNESTTRCVLDGLVTVLEGRPDGERVPMSEVRTRTHRWVSKPKLAEVLADLELLDDDTTPTIRSWIERNTDSLEPGFAKPVRRWLITLVEGDTRSRPRTGGLRLRLLRLRPPLPRTMGHQIRPSTGGHQNRHLCRAGSPARLPTPVAQLDRPTSRPVAVTWQAA